jgi:hypothetical protein
VAELSAAIRVIKELRELSKQASFPEEKQQADELLDKVVQSVGAYYRLIRTYTDEGFYLAQEMFDQPKMIPEDARLKILFKEQWGRFVCEFNTPLYALEEYLELARTYSPQLAEIKRHQVFTIFDKITEKVLDLLVLYQRHLDGEIDLLNRDFVESHVVGIASVARAVYPILDLDELLVTTVNSISDYLGYYHVHIYLLDDKKEWAVMRAGSGVVGEVLLKHNYKIQVNSSTLVGWCIEHRQACVGMKGDEIGANFHHSLNPLMREWVCWIMVLPLTGREGIIGALEIQHIVDEPKLRESLFYYEFMADYIAAAIDNALLFRSIEK